MLRAPSIAFAALLLVAARASAQQTDLAYDPQRRVVVAPGAELSGADALTERLRRIEQDTSFRFVVAVVPDAGATPVRRALALRDGWADHAAFEGDRTFVVLFQSDRPRDPPAVVLPSGVADRLGLTLRRVARIVDDHWRPRADAAAALAEMAQRIDRRLAELEADHIRKSERDRTTRQELERQVQQDIALVSSRLTELELRCAELRASGLVVGGAEDRLDELRRDLADALDAHAQAPESLVTALVATRQAGAEVEADLARLEQQRREATDRIKTIRTDLDQLGLPLESLVAASTPNEAATQAHGLGRRALEAAAAQLAKGEPAAALAKLDEAAAHVAQVRRALAPPPARPRSPVPLIIFALLMLAAVGALVVQLVRRALASSQATARHEALRDAASGLAAALEEELGALRTLYLRASRPVPATLPERLGSSRPAAVALGGESAEHLARARGTIDELHRTWRELRLMLGQSDGLFAATGLPGVAVIPLERLPSRKLPARKIRETAQLLERLARAPQQAAERLQDAARAVEQAEAQLEKVLQAGQSPQPFEDDVGAILEEALDGAHRASSDPIGATRAGSDAVGGLPRLEERVKRTLELAAGAAALRERLAALPAPAGVPGDQDLPTLTTWAWHLADEVLHDLDEGARDEATRELDRALGLARDAELIGKGLGRRPDAELALLRDELHQARLALDAMKKEFAAEAWSDAEVALLRAAARLELVAARLLEGGRIPRLQARLSSIRAATLLCTTRLLHLRGERERATSLLEVLEGRARAIDTYLERERQAVTPATLEQWLAARRDLERLGVMARDPKGPPAWDRFGVELNGLEAAFDRVRARAGDDALRLRRAVALAQGLEKAVREAEDVVRRVDPGCAGAALRIAAAKRGLEAARAAFSGGPVEARALHPVLEASLRACRDAREQAAPRILRLGQGEGAAGDARHMLLLARQAFGRAHRFWALGVTGDPAELRERMAAVEAAVAIDPAGALAQVAEAIERFEEAAAAALLREQAAHDAARDARGLEDQEQARGRHQLLRTLRQDELHRRTRFEVLVLGEAEEAAAEVEDIDAADEDEDEELEALEFATTLEPTSDERPPLGATVAEVEAARASDLEAIVTAPTAEVKTATAEELEAGTKVAPTADVKAATAEELEAGTKVAPTAEVKAATDAELGDATAVIKTAADAELAAELEAPARRADTTEVEAASLGDLDEPAEPTPADAEPTLAKPADAAPTNGSGPTTGAPASEAPPTSPTG